MFLSEKGVVYLPNYTINDLSGNFPLNHGSVIVGETRKVHRHTAWLNMRLGSVACTPRALKTSR